MGYRTLRECVDDLARHGQLKRVDADLDPRLELAAVQRRSYQRGGPALLFTRVRGCRFPVLANLFGTRERAQFLFRDTLPYVRQLLELRLAPGTFRKRPWQFLKTAWHARHMLPKRTRQPGCLTHAIQLSELPGVVSWPLDGGPFITLPIVYTEDPAQPGWKKSNLGMYRVQLAGNAYLPEAEVGLHYQIHRGIGVHHTKAKARQEPLPVRIHVGGPPAHILAAVMPLPEGMPELFFAGLLSGHRTKMTAASGSLPALTDADFCISGYIRPEETKPEGPFGDHLGYYSLRHSFPVMQVTSVTHRPDAIWPFTSVGRPPQEDTAFGDLIHEITGPAIPAVIPGVQAVHAVDAAGVHPLLLAQGSERYEPFRKTHRPQELLTQARAILGQGQLSLAKYLLIVAQEDDPALDIHDLPKFMGHLLARFDPSRDLHFETQTTIDTLDYSGDELNQGSKLTWAAVGPVRRELATHLPPLTLPDGYGQARLCMPGVLAVQGPPAGHAVRGQESTDMLRFCQALDLRHPINACPLVVVCDDSAFVAQRIENWAWVTFTRSNPASDVYGIESFAAAKHWGCRGSVVIDARLKPHHAPVLEEDPAVIQRIESLATRGGPLEGLI